MFDHLGVGVSDLEISKSFFLQCLAPLDVKILATADRAVGLGRNVFPEFWLDAKYKSLPQHIAFSASTRKQVDDFYRLAIAAGGIDNGKPGERPYGFPKRPLYYAAFIIGPDNHNIEMVFRG